VNKPTKKPAQKASPKSIARPPVRECYSAQPPDTLYARQSQRAFAYAMITAWQRAFASEVNDWLRLLRARRGDHAGLDSDHFTQTELMLEKVLGELTTELTPPGDLREEFFVLLNAVGGKVGVA
jgi:hypothetical protein